MPKPCKGGPFWAIKTKINMGDSGCHSTGITISGELGKLLPVPKMYPPSPDKMALIVAPATSGADPRGVTDRNKALEAGIYSMFDIFKESG